MVYQVMRVCVFCILCTTRTSCLSHAVEEASSRDVLYPENATNIALQRSIVIPLSISSDSPPHRNENDSRTTFDGLHETEHGDYIKSLFDTVGNGQNISIADIQQVLRQPSDKNEQSQSDPGCFDVSSLPNTLKSVRKEDLGHYCPAILAKLLLGPCTPHSHADHLHDHDDHGQSLESSVEALVWIYSICAVTVISACGILAVVIIPVMKKKFYKPLLQFLVALAVGTLTGDALLHLLPHAMSSDHHHHHTHGQDGGHETHAHDVQNIWKGLVAALGLTLFFVMERIIPIVCRKKKFKNNKNHVHVKVLGSDPNIAKNNGTQCKDKYNAYPLCYKDILNDPNTTFESTSDAKLDIKGTAKDGPNLDKLDNSKKLLRHFDDRLLPNATKTDGVSLCKHHTDDAVVANDLVNGINGNNGGGDDGGVLSEKNNMLIVGSTARASVNEHADCQDTDYTVILTEHAATHHGHSHTHGHVHAAPQSLSSVVWMVIMGDGLHNFTDGMAIGAAFASSITGGFSTTVAVLCHELPHELGDFAMLLKAGMSVRQALYYNILSSVLCLIGNVIGIWLGNNENASSWVFAVAAGTFIYIALVDMLPELSSSHEDERNLAQGILHLCGLLLGIGIMTLIAIYEHDLKMIFNHVG